MQHDHKDKRSALPIIISQMSALRVCILSMSIAQEDLVFLPKHFSVENVMGGI